MAGPSFAPAGLAYASFLESRAWMSLGSALLDDMPVPGELRDASPGAQQGCRAWIPRALFSVCEHKEIACNAPPRPHETVFTSPERLPLADGNRASLAMSQKGMSPRHRWQGCGNKLLRLFIFPEIGVPSVFTIAAFDTSSLQKDFLLDICCMRAASANYEDEVQRAFQTVRVGHKTPGLLIYPSCEQQTLPTASST